MKALIIIDVQNDFLPGGSLAVPNSFAIIPVINSVSPTFEYVIATQDWHPINHQSFAIQHPNNQPFDTIDIKGQAQILWPVHCVQNSNGATISTLLELKSIGAIIRKGMDIHIDSYSGFYDNAKQKTTGLNGYLKELSITEVYICGLAADYCVYFTAMDALTAGYITFIILDATAALDNNHFEVLKQNFVNKGGKLIFSNEMI